MLGTAFLLTALGAALLVAGFARLLLLPGALQLGLRVNQLSGIP
jgi:hypothetical protein